MPDNPPSTLLSRRVAAQLLGPVLRRKQLLEQELTRHKDFAALETRDRAFVQLLVKTTLRRIGQIDALLSNYLQTPLPDNAGFAHDTLRIAVTQLIWLKTPPHAAVHSAVELVKQQRHISKFSGVVNAVLQRVVREGAALIAQQDEARINVPHWLWESWRQAHGEQTTRAVCRAILQEPPLDIWAKERAPEWAETLNATLLPNGSIRLQEVDSLTSLSGFSEGRWWVQDAAATLPALLLGDVRGKNVLDMCAAPGGKTMQLLAAGAQVTALDISSSRMRRVRENLQRLHLHADCVVQDATQFTPTSPPDIILLDAPCSATGTLRRHPDVSRHRTPEDIQRLAALQRALIHHALDILPTHGLLAYAVCSMQPEEGEEQIKALLQSRADVTLHPSGAFDRLEGMAQKNAHGWRTFPSFLPAIGGMDGFFMTLLEKR